MSNLNQVDMFISFLELVQNPEKYKAMMTEMKTRSEDLRVSVEAYTEVQSANKYFGKIKAAHMEEVSKLDVAKSAFEGSKATWAKDLESKEMELAAKVKSASEMQAKVRAMNTEMLVKDKALVLEVMAMEKAQAALVLAQEAVNVQVVALAKKEAALKELFKA